MSGSIGYWFSVDRDSSSFDMQVDYTVDGYNDPETGESFYETSWNYTYHDVNSGIGGGTGGYGWESETVPIYIGFPSGEDVADATLTFTAMNSFSADSVSMSWHILNAGLALGDKVLTGTSDLDIVISGYGADELYGLEGDDYLDSGDGNDRLYGGDGSDWLDGGAGDDQMDGGAGDDLFVVDSLSDQVVELEGGGYDMVVTTTSYTLGAYVEALLLDGSDAIDGTGNDEDNDIAGNMQANVLIGLTGDDTLYGYDGDDTLLGGDGFDILEGGLGDDHMEGGLDDDIYVVNSLADTVVENADEGMDQVVVWGLAAYKLGDNVEILVNVDDSRDFRGTGNATANMLVGALANDTLLGRAGDDLLIGSDGDDILLGGAGADELDGGFGRDSASYSQAASAVAVNLESGLGMLGEAIGDSFFSIEGLIGSAHDDQLTGDSGANRLSGRDGDDILRGGDGRDILTGGAGADDMDGGGGGDTVSYAGSTAGVWVDLLTQTASGGDADGDTLANFSHVEGSSKNDILTGNGQTNLLIGGAGDDQLDGGAGNDILRGGLGADTMIGGLGIDTLDYSHSSLGVSVNLGTGAASGGDAQGDSFSGFERLIGSAQGDELAGDTGNNRIEGGDGDDILRGGSGNDVIIGGRGADRMNGGAGIDTISYEGSTHWVSLYLETGTAYGVDGVGDKFRDFENARGSEVGDAIYGSSDNNVLYGGGGNDYIMGGGGNDRIYGGDGDDIFNVFGVGVQRIMDFTAGDGTDDSINVVVGEDYDSFIEVMAIAVQDGDDTIFDFGGGKVLILDGIDKTSLALSDFVFT